MIQLRDAKTSELIAEGDALTIVIIARGLGVDGVIGSNEDVPPGMEVIYDNVTPTFDPDAVIAAEKKRIAGLQATVDNAARLVDELTARIADPDEVSAEVSELEASKAKAESELTRLEARVQEEAGALEPDQELLSAALEKLEDARATMEI